MPAPLKCGHTTRVADSHNRFSRPSICSGTRDQVYLVHHQQYFLPVEAAPRSPPDNSLPVVLQQQFGCTCTSMHDAGLYAVLFLRFMIPERDRGTRTLRCGAIAGIPSNKKTCITPHSLLYMTYICIRRRAKRVLARLGVPIVDAAQIVEGQAWASKPSDGRHYHSLVPLEIFALLGALVSPPPTPLPPAGGVAARGESRDSRLHLTILDDECGG